MIQIAVETNNLIQGPATLYRGAFSAAEPLDTAINTTPAASSWTDVGGTTDGVTLNIENTYGELEVDQIVERVGSRLTKRDTSVETNMAEVTLENLAYALNGGTAASGAGFKSYEPTVDTSATQPTYSAILFDGIAPQSFRRRVIVRKVLSTDSLGIAYTKDKQTVLKIKMQAHYVTSVIKPYKIVDATS